MDNVVLPMRYWCHICSRIIYSAPEAELECSYCHNGFIEEMMNDQETQSEMDYGRVLSLWAPILLGMMNTTWRQRRTRRSRFESDEPNRDDRNNINRGRGSRFYIRQGSEPDHSDTIMQLIEGVRVGLSNETVSERDGDRDRDRGLVIEPFNRTIILRGPTASSSLVDFLGDYFMGRGLDLVLQHLAEIEPNRYGTPPTRKEVIEALPTIEVKEASQCSVCLDEFEIGEDVKETPCKHRFHENCIFPWLELHSTCPLCRFQLPVDEFKLDEGGSMNVGSDDGGNRVGEGEGRVLNRRRFSIPWLISGLFGTASSSSSSETAVERSSSSLTDGN